MQGLGIRHYADYLRMLLDARLKEKGLLANTLAPADNNVSASKGEETCEAETGTV
jgi:hypothetical protein